MSWADEYVEHGPAVCAFLRRRLPRGLRGAFDAEDFLQDAMVSILQFGSEPRPETAWNYLTLVATRKLISQYRRKFASQEQYEEELEPISADDPVLESESRELVQGLLGRLEAERRLVVLMLLDGHGRLEVARCLGLSVRSVQRILRQIRLGLERRSHE